MCFQNRKPTPPDRPYLHLHHHSPRQHPLHRSYPSLRERSVASDVGVIRSKMSSSKSTGGKMDSIIKLEYTQLVLNVIVIVTLRSFQERVCSLADEYLDTSLAYSTQAAKCKNALTLICELVRYLSNHTDVQLITVGRFPMNFQYFSNSRITG